MSAEDLDVAARASTRRTGRPSCRSIHEHFATFGDRLPQPLRDQLAALEQRLDSAS